MCTEKPADSCDSLYFDIRFIVVIWHRTHDISEVCLYLPPPPLFALHVPSSTLCLCLVGEAVSVYFSLPQRPAAHDGGSHMEEEEKEARL